MSTDTIDYLALLVGLAQDAGVRVCLPCLATDSGPAGSRRGPAPVSTALDPYQVAACDVLLAATHPNVRTASVVTLGVVSASVHLALATRVVMLMLPAVAQAGSERMRTVRSWADGSHDRYEAPGSEDDFYGELDWLEQNVQHTAHRLQQLVVAHDAGEWVDPRVVAGVVADLQDGFDAIADVADTWLT